MMLPPGLARMALYHAALLRSQQSQEATANILDVISDDGWALQEGARLKTAYSFVADEWSHDGIRAELACAVAAIVQ